jgi:hypothetical protein
MILLSAQKRKQVSLLTCVHLDGVNDDPISDKERNYVVLAPSCHTKKKSHHEIMVQSNRNQTSKTKTKKGSGNLELASRKFSKCELASTGTETICFRLQQKSGAAPRKHVSFGFIHVREHALTVGEHDWCDGSLAITLDWTHAETRSMGVDDFEWMRERQGRTPRGRLTKLGSQKRKYLLQHVSGISAESLAVMRHSKAKDKTIRTRRHSKTVTTYPR